MQFNAWAKNFGGGLDVTKAHPVVADRLNRIVSEIDIDVSLILQDFANRSIRGLDLKFGFLNGDKFQCKSGILQDTDFVAVNIGYYCTVREMIGRMLEKRGCHLLSEKSLYQKCPSSWYEPRAIDHLLTEHDRFMSNNNEIVALDNLVLHSCRFAFHHEMAHLWNGHLNFKATLAGGVENLAPMGIPINQIYQAFELDADARATSATIRVLAAGIMGSSYNRYFFSVSLSGLCCEYKLYFSAFLIYTSMRMMVYEDIGKFSQSASSHPPSKHRMVWVTEMIMQNYSLFTNQSDFKMKQILFNAVQQAESAFCEVTDQEPLDVFDNDLISEAAGYRRELLMTWDLMLPVLQKYKRGASLPHVIDKSEGKSYFLISDINKHEHLVKYTINLFSVDPIYWSSRNVDSLRRLCRLNHLVFNKSAYYDLQNNISNCEFYETGCNTDEQSYNLILSAWKNLIIAWQSFKLFFNNLAKTYEVAEWHEDFTSLIVTDRIVYYVDQRSNWDHTDASKFLKLENSANDLHRMVLCDSGLPDQHVQHASIGFDQILFHHTHDLRLPGNVIFIARNFMQASLDLLLPAMDY